MSKSKVLFIMTGSIACYKACNVISKLTQQGHEVQVVATESALKFVGNPTIEGLTGKTAITDLFAAGNVMDHIHLARWADLLVVAPATASFMNKMANGIADDLASTLFLAHDFTKPFLVAPAMNSAMYRHPTTQESLKKLAAMGVKVLDSDEGLLACGETGFGRLLEPEQILEAINLHLKTPFVENRTEKIQASGKIPYKILVTAGGTQEAIDDVRVISNVSTGKTGYKIAHYLMEAGYDVELLRASRAEIPSEASFPTHQFTDFKSLDSQLQLLLSDKKFTHVIHAAAVSDYSIDPIQGKMDSSIPVSLKLRPNPKLISKIKSYSKNPNLKVIGFKLTSHLPLEEQIAKVDKLLTDADYVVHNDLSEISKERHKFTFWGLKKPRVYENVEQLSVGLIQAISTEVKT
jgi:phosphopantothenoylcysteine decarboxylase/phosphopantothenate--cysteine ligase